MLNTISWQQYIVAVFLLTAAWYAYVGLRYYQPELSSFLKIKSKPTSALPEVATAHSVMGTIQPDVGTSLHDAQELIFSIASDDAVSDQTLPKGPADDLLAEAETLISAFEENDDKKGFLSLLKILISKYEVFADEISLLQTITSLKASSTKLPFKIQAPEWPLTFEA